MKKLLSVLMALTMLFVCAGCTDIEALGKPERTYLVDVKVLQLEATTKVEIYDQNEELAYTIKGKFFTLFTDPMDVFNKDYTCIGKITDEFNFFRQDDHSIIINGEEVIRMEGLYQFVGEKYNLMRGDELIGVAEFDLANWTGKIADCNGNIVASYKRVNLEQDFMLKDFEVRVYNNEMLEDLEALMIITAYHSDRMADERASNNSSSSSNNSSY